MTLPVDVAKVRLTTDGVSAGPFGLTGGSGALYAAAPTHLVVTHVPTATGVAVVLTYGSDYTIGGDITVGAATITTGVALAAGVLTVRRLTPRLQGSTWREGDGNPSLRFESTSDLGRMIDQEAAEKLSRAVVAPDYEAPLDMTLEAVATRASKITMFDSQGRLRASPTSAADIAAVAGLSTIVAEVDAARDEVVSAVTLITYYGQHKNANNIFDAASAAVINAIQHRNYGAYGVSNADIDALFATVGANPGPWVLPVGDYRPNATITGVSGTRFIGMLNDRALGTVFYSGGASNGWGFSQANPNGTQQVKGYTLEDMFIYASQNLARWNTTTGGYDDTSGTQQYMMQPRVLNVGMNMNSGTKRRALQFNKCFNFVVEDCQTENFLIDLDVQGCDYSRVMQHRSNGNADAVVTCDAQGTFGSGLLFDNCDWNTAKNNFIRSTYRKMTVRGTHMELDGSPGGGGVGGNMAAAIAISGGNAFQHSLMDNSTDFNAFCDNWLSASASVNLYKLEAFGNVTASAPVSMGGVAFPSQYYWTNSQSRSIVAHGRNAGSGQGLWPMNNDEMSAPPVGCYAYVTPGRPGVAFAGIAGALTCSAGFFVLPYNASAGQYIEFSDWSSLGLPANQLIGTMSVEVMTAAGAAGLVANWELFDGASSVATGTITHTLANAGYRTVISATHGYSTNLKLRMWNADGSANERFYVQTFAAKGA